MSSVLSRTFESVLAKYSKMCSYLKTKRESRLFEVFSVTNGYSFTVTFAHWNTHGSS